MILFSFLSRKAIGSSPIAFSCILHINLPYDSTLQWTTSSQKDSHIFIVLFIFIH
jgi:hypothetical protein